MRLTPARTLIATAAALAATTAVALAQEPPKAPTVRVAFVYDGNAPRVMFERFVVQGIPDGATVDVRCLTAAGKRCKPPLRRAFRKQDVSGGTVVVTRFMNRRIRPGRKLVATVTAPGYLTIYKTVTITRKGAIPIETECSQPGSGERGPC